MSTGQEAGLKKADATVVYGTKQFQRIKELVDRAAVERRLLEEEEQHLIEARNAYREASTMVELARARLKTAEARVKLVEFEAKLGKTASHPPTVASPRRR